MFLFCVSVLFCGFVWVLCVCVFVFLLCIVFICPLSYDVCLFVCSLLLLRFFVCVLYLCCVVVCLVCGCSCCRCCSVFLLKLRNSRDSIESCGNGDDTINKRC